MDVGKQQPNSSRTYTRCSAKASLQDHDYDLDSFFAEMKRNITAPALTSESEDGDDDSIGGSAGEDEEQRQQCKC